MQRRLSRALIGLVLVAGVAAAGYLLYHHRRVASSRQPTAGRAVADGFDYGFDFDSDIPTSPVAHGHNVQTGVTSALAVMSHFSGAMMDQSMYGFGAADPEPNPVPARTPLSPSNTDLSSIGHRLQLIAAAGGVPVITLVAAPPWMVGCNNLATTSCAGDRNPDCVDNPSADTLFATPPCPAHYQDFAKLAAYVATSFPQVKYFVVWSELRGFYDDRTESIDAASYTQMYNDVYRAIKRARPDALVGGPYADFSAKPCDQPPSYPMACPRNSLSGSWGYTQPDVEQAVTYWLAHKAGADFLAVDGDTEIASRCRSTQAHGYSCRSGDLVPTDPLTPSLKFAAVDAWLRARTDLPIWWIESHIQPLAGTAGAWTEPEAAAARIATLALMNASGASVGMQWNPQGASNGPDLGLWTTTTKSVAAGGGQPTLLEHELTAVLPLLRSRLTVVPGQTSGVLAATGADDRLLLVDTNGIRSQATVDHATFSLGPDEVTVVATP